MKGTKMGGLILCRTKEAKNPYYICNMDLHIYSLEELCYYIYHNIYLIGPDFINEKLLEFIRTEVEEELLAQKIETMLKQKAGISEIVITILKYVDYYTLTEIEELQAVLNTLDSQNVYERLKARADTFLENHSYYNAAQNYEMIINGKRDNTLSGIFYTKVYHNAGVALARMFFFKKARQYFEEAYRIGQHEESYRCSLTAAMMERQSDGRLAESLEGEVEEKDLETLDIIKKKLNTLLEDAEQSPECLRIKRAYDHKNGEDDTDYYEELEEVISNWEKQYYKFTT